MKVQEAQEVAAERGVKRKATAVADGEGVKGQGLDEEGVAVLGQ
jgi:hypothetical protein